MEKLFFICNQRRVHQIDSRDVAYLLSYGMFVMVQLRNGTTIQTTVPLEKFLIQQHNVRFVRISQMLVVPLNDIESVINDHVVFNGLSGKVEKRYVGRVVKAFRRKVEARFLEMINTGIGTPFLRLAKS